MPVHIQYELLGTCTSKSEDHKGTGAIFEAESRIFGPVDFSGAPGECLKISIIKPKQHLFFLVTSFTLAETNTLKLAYA